MHRDGDPTPPPDPLRRYDQGPSGAGRLFGLGFQFAGAILLCVLVGQWVDRRFGTEPWGVLAGAMVGFAAGLYALVRAGEREIGGKGEGEGEVNGETGVEGEMGRDKG